MKSLTLLLLLFYIGYLHYLIEVKAADLSPVRTLWGRLTTLAAWFKSKIDTKGR